MRESSENMAPRRGHTENRKIICLACGNKNKKCSDINTDKHLLPVIYKYANPDYNPEVRNSSLEKKMFNIDELL